MSANDKLAATFGPGRTTPTPTLETRIAEVVAQALELDDDDNGAWHTRPPSEHPAIIAAALAPLIAEAQAEAFERCINHVIASCTYVTATAEEWRHKRLASDLNDVKSSNPYRSNDE